METTNDKNTFFREALREELLRRVRKNSNYSIRSFAQYLEVEPSSLSQILSGKRALTDKMCQRLGMKLGFGPEKMKLLTRNAPSPEDKTFRSFQKIEEDTFKVISDWYYYAILELTYCENFRPNPKWIAKVLGLTLAESIDAIERLKNLNYLQATSEGNWVDRLGDVNKLSNEFKAPAFTEHQRQVLIKAGKALDITPGSSCMSTPTTS